MPTQLIDLRVDEETGFDMKMSYLFLKLSAFLQAATSIGTESLTIRGNASRRRLRRRNATIKNPKNSFAL